MSFLDQVLTIWLRPKTTYESEVPRDLLSHDEIEAAVMTPSALKAKATALTTRLIGAAYGHGLKRNELTEGAVVAATSDLAALVEALLALAYAVDDTSDLIEDTRVLAALSRLEELTK
jgi:hypothetical protein